MLFISSNSSESSENEECKCLKEEEIGSFTVILKKTFE